MKKFIPNKFFKIFQKLKSIFIILLYMVFSIFKLKDTIVLYSPSRKTLQGNLLYIKNCINNKKVYEFLDNINLIRFLYCVATSKLIITDDYSPILYPIKFRKDTKFIQVWHASGMFKKVGFSRIGTAGGPKENSITHRNYTDVIVSSTNIVKEYSKAFKLNTEKIKPLGIPRTDLFFNKERLEELKQQFIKKYPMCKNKKIVLYAPTFRGNGKNTAYTDTNILNIDTLANKLSNNYIILVKHHPFSKNNFNFTNKNIIDISKIEDINEILPNIDILITDYSSVIFDVLLLEKNLILYVPDLEKYEQERGLYYNINYYNFGSIAKNELELINAIKNPIYNKEIAKKIKSKHLNMCDGLSTKRFIDTYLS